MNEWKVSLGYFEFEFRKCHHMKTTVSNEAVKLLPLDEVNRAPDLGHEGIKWCCSGTWLCSLEHYVTIAAWLPSRISGHDINLFVFLIHFIGFLRFNTIQYKPFKMTEWILTIRYTFTWTALWSVEHRVDLMHGQNKKRKYSRKIQHGICLWMEKNWGVLEELCNCLKNTWTTNVNRPK